MKGEGERGRGRERERERERERKREEVARPHVKPARERNERERTDFETSPVPAT